MYCVEKYKREYLDYWYSLSGNLGCTKSFGLKVWMKQQETIDEQFEMLLNQANTIKKYQDKIKLLKELFEETISGNDSDIQSYYRKQFEDIENE